MTGDTVSFSLRLLLASFIALAGCGNERTQTVTFQVAAGSDATECNAVMTIADPCTTVQVFDSETGAQLPLVDVSDSERKTVFKLQFEGNTEPRFDVTLEPGAYRIAGRGIPGLERLGRRLDAGARGRPRELAGGARGAGGRADLQPGADARSARACACQPPERWAGAQRPTSLMRMTQTRRPRFLSTLGTRRMRLIEGGRFSMTSTGISVMR